LEIIVNKFLYKYTQVYCVTVILYGAVMVRDTTRSYDIVCDGLRIVGKIYNCKDLGRMWGEGWDELINSLKSNEKPVQIDLVRLEFKEV